MNKKINFTSLHLNMTLDETSAIISAHEGRTSLLSRERVRQLEARALRKVRIGLEERGYGPEDFLREDHQADDCRVEPTIGSGK